MKNKSIISNRILAIFITIGILIFIAIDQITKVIAFNNLKGNDSIVLIKNIFSLTYIENKGAAWGLFAGKMGIFVIVTMIVVPVLILFIFRIQKVKRTIDNKRSYSILQMLIVVLISGAIGNCIDRVSRGFVVDFFEFTFIDFPVFNVADCYITVGTTMLILLVMFALSDEDFNLITSKKPRKELD